MKRMLLVLSACLLSGACEAFTPPDAPSFPANPALAAPSKIVLNVSSRLDHRLDVAATVLNGSGAPLPDIAVAFAIGEGSVTPSTALTDREGVARGIATSAASTTIVATIGGGITSSVPVLPSD